MDPAITDVALKAASASKHALPPLLWLGKKVGVNSEPNLRIGPDLRAGGLTNESRPAYIGNRYRTVACANRQRLDVRSKWVRTRDAIACRGTVRVINGLGYEVKRDDVLFCGPPDRRPTTETILTVEDERFHIPLLAQIDDWTSHHVMSDRRLQPGTYLLGARFFAGLDDMERLPAGVYTLELTVGCANGGTPAVWTSSTIDVPTCEPLEPDVVFSAPPVSADSSMRQWLNVEARCSRRLASIANVRLKIAILGGEYDLNWSENTGDFRGQASVTLTSDSPTLALIAVRLLDQWAKLGLPYPIGAGYCVLADRSLRVNDRLLLQLPEGEHHALLTAFYGTTRIDQRLRILVPPPDQGGLSVAIP